MGNALYYGDNLAVLRESIASASIDLIYLDPPFNSQANYNLLFKGPSGKGADAQIEAFEDTWHWGEEAERAFSEVLASPATQAAELLRAMRSFLGENDMMAYLAMMAVRLDRTAPGAEADRLALSALRPDRQPLSENLARRDLRSANFETRSSGNARSATAMASQGGTRFGDITIRFYYYARLEVGHLESAISALYD